MKTAERRCLMRKAYWINTFTAIHDAAKLEAYIRLAGPAMQAAGGRFLALGNPAAAFESGTTARTTLIEFPSVDDAVAAYHSAAYPVGFQKSVRACGLRRWATCRVPELCRTV